MAFNNNNIINDLFNTLYGCGFDIFDNAGKTTDQPKKKTPADSEEVVPSYYFDRKDTAVTAYIELPGCAKESIDVSLEKDVVTVKASRKIAETETKYGFSFRVGRKRDLNKLNVSYKDGLLTIVMPTKEEVQTGRTKLDIQ